LPRVLPARYVPPSGFDYPLDGFLPSGPCRFCFTPAALLGFALRSFPRSRSIRPFPTELTHLPFHPPVYPPPKRPGRPDGPRFLGRDPLERPWSPNAWLARRPLAAPLGFCPSRVLRWKPCSGFRPGSSHALGNGPEGREPPAPQSINQPPVGLIGRQRQAPPLDEATLLGFWHQCAPAHAKRLVSGL
jgi:hypothetical protein